jgi:hypothetical protein
MLDVDISAWLSAIPFEMAEVVEIDRLVAYYEYTSFLVHR